MYTFISRYSYLLEILLVYYTIMYICVRARVPEGQGRPQKCIKGRAINFLDNNNLRRRLLLAIKIY